ncbi:uncharacterized protein TA19410 [Theileria annulata]|uniref:Uncharacterized protein n=1 Tax=Theileria annulata TaxID=5874 RepID=Q4UGF2_THEAN|nr:uncharacterized protein TA19410 [Theileria annulata]CAI73837.1 hypothetical protein TA19410 [Theileria annulata]|eukprot:XP_954514.1 hypothetical protein TA19410 [Theileria annulata]
MDTAQNEPLLNKDKKGHHTGGLSEEEILECSEKLSGLNHESKSMLFLLCLSTFNDLQNRFLEKYKGMLDSKKIKGTEPTPEELMLYKKLLKSQDTFLNTPLEEDAEPSQSSSQPPTESTTQETSLLRTLWRRYRIEFYIKAMLIIFLLKLPYFCYIFTTVVYIMYCFGFFDLVARLSQHLRNNQNAQTVVRYFLRFMDNIEPVLLIQLNQDMTQQQRVQQQHRTQQQTQTQTQTQTLRQQTQQETQEIQPETVTNISTPDTSEQSQVVPPRSSTAPIISEQEVSPPTVRQRPATARVEGTISQNGLLRVTFSSSNSEQSSTRSRSRSFRERIELLRRSHRPSQRNDSVPQPGQCENVREKPTYFEKFVYQVFFSFILSLLPWWEPNPIYLEE